jgi:hypothetical protein
MSKDKEKLICNKINAQNNEIIVSKEDENNVQNEVKKSDKKIEIEQEPKAPIRRNRIKRKKAEQKHCCESKENYSSIGLLNLPNVLDILVKDSEQQLEELQTDLYNRSKTEINYFTSVQSEKVEKESGE